MYFFMLQLESPLIDDETIDLNPYNKVGCMRMYLNSKLGKNNKLVFKRGINYDFKDRKTCFMDCLLRNVGHINVDDYVPIELPTNVKVKKTSRTAKRRDFRQTGKKVNKKNH